MRPSKSILRYLPRKKENIYLHKNLHMNIHISISHNSQKQEAMCVSQLTKDRRNVVYPYNRILFSNNKEEAIDTCHDVCPGPFLSLVIDISVLKQPVVKHYTQGKEPGRRNHIL